MAKIVQGPHGRNNRYTRAEKLQAVAIVREYANGESVVLSDECFAAVRSVFPAVGYSTMWRWWNEFKDSVEIEQVAKALEVRAERLATEDEGKMLLTAYRLLLTKMTDAEYVAAAPMSAVIRGIETIEEMIRTRLGLDTKTIAALQRLSRVAKRMEYDVPEVLNAVSEQIEAKERELPHLVTQLEQAIHPRRRGRPPKA